MWVLDFRHDALTPIFKALSFSGDSTFFLLVFTVGYWIVDRRIFARATLMLLVAVLANSVLKAVFQIPRPDAAFFLIEAHGWSFPSGHAMVAGAVWPWLALESKRRWALPVAALLALAVAASRVYLGVHTLLDVSVGLALGALLILPARAWAASPPPPWQRAGVGAQTLLLGVLAAVFLSVAPIYQDDTVGAQAAGALVALWLGLAWDRKQGHALPIGAARKVAAAVLGLAGTFGLRVLLKGPLAALPLSLAWSDAIRYGCVGLWIAAGATACFYALGLARPDPESLG